jgi:dTDP-4-dehydrorhamnose reductase
MDDSKFVIVGAEGQLGKALQATYPNARGTNSTELDISDKNSVENYDWSEVTHILNAAAYTNVDGAETPEGRVATWEVNATGVGYMAEIAQQNEITLVHISTDYVFDGSKQTHTENELLSPLSIYGSSKAAGEIAAGLAPKHYILRTSWVIGDGKNFVLTMISLAEKGISPTVVNDQVGRLTFSSELARAIDHLLKNDCEYGIYNLSNSGDSASWADITREIFKLLGRDDLSVTDTTTAEYFAGKSGIAPRPLQSTLDLSKIQKTGFNPKDWKEGLNEYIKGEKA